MIKTFMPFNLQFFAEDEEKEDETSQASTDDSSKDEYNEEGKKRYIMIL